MVKIVVKSKIAVATVADSRNDYYLQRKNLLEEELGKIVFLKSLGETLYSEIIRTPEAAVAFAKHAKRWHAEVMIIHIPIWADPELTLFIAENFNGPVLILGNKRSETSSVVGMLGAGGGLDQNGIPHERVYGMDEDAQKRIAVFVQAASTKAALYGNKMLRFGDRSLGIVTADPNEELWERDFGVRVQAMKQQEIVSEADRITEEELSRCRSWIMDNAKVCFDDVFTKENFDKQIRSYLATCKLVRKYEGDFVGVKCQKELSDGYVVQCLAHCLMNGRQSVDGVCPATAYACEADANGAITMRILNLISGGSPATLLDIRTFEQADGTLTLANCGAAAAELLAEETAPELSGMHFCRHTFGLGGGGGCRGELRSGHVTLARLCVKNGEHCMTIVSGAVVKMSDAVRDTIPYSFPCALVRTGLDETFLQEYDSNHIHLVYGDYTQQLEMFCKLCKVKTKIYRM